MKMDDMYDYVRWMRMMDTDAGYGWRIADMNMGDGYGYVVDVDDYEWW